MIEISQAAKQAASTSKQIAAADTKAAQDPLSEVGNDSRTLLLKCLIESITGRRVNVLTVGDLQGAPASPVDEKVDQPPAGQTSNEPHPAGWGIEYDRHEHYQESEQTNFSA